MNNIRYHLFVITLIALASVFVSCNPVDPLKNKQVSPVFESEDYLSIKEKVFMNELIYPDFMSKVGDMIVISSSKSDTMLHFYHIPDLTHVQSFGIKGNGPDDISFFPMFCENISDSNLYIWGYNLVKIRKFTLTADRRLLQKKEIELSAYEPFNCMNIIDDRYFFYFNVDRLKIKKIDLVKNRSTEIDFEKETHKESFYYSNRGIMAMNNKYIVYAYLFKNQIDIYDSNDLSLYKRLLPERDGLVVTGGEKYNINYNYCHHLVTTENYIYLYRSDEKKRSILEIYDYEGNPIKKYILEMPVPLFVVDESKKILIGFEDKSEDYLYVYQLL